MKSSPPAAPATRIDHLAAAWGPLILVAAVIAVYANSFNVPFLLDEIGSILGNPSLDSLWRSLVPRSGGDTVAGRPLLNFSFAVNRALSGNAVWSYHAINLLIHLGSSLLVFGLLRRIFARYWPREGSALALITALLWALHPLQTESVTYIVQRAESLAGCFYLLTLYAFVRAIESAIPRRWLTLSVAACFLGVATKEVVVSAPLLVLLYDRTFGAGTFREAWARRRGYYLALAGSWLLLGSLLVATAGRGGTAEIGGAAWWPYLLTQCGAIVHYLRLVFWPHPLVFDYGIGLVRDPTAAVLPGLLLLGLLAATIRQLRRPTATGFAGAAFFAILAPSSSVVPVVTQTIAEHRMYLPLLPVLALAVAGMRHWVGNRGAGWALLLVPVLAALTLHRNAVYQDELRLWRETVENYPQSARAHNNLGAILVQKSQVEEAVPEFEEALRLRPDYLQAMANLGGALLQLGQVDRGLDRFEQLLKLHPDDFEGQVTLAEMLQKVGRSSEAIDHLRTAIQLRPDAVDPRVTLGNLLVQADRAAEAIEPYRQAAALDPDQPGVHANLASALAILGRFDESMSEYERSLELRPDSAGTRLGYALVLHQLGRDAEAVTQLREALRTDPSLQAAQQLLDEIQKGSSP